MICKNCGKEQASHGKRWKAGKWIGIAAAAVVVILAVVCVLKQEALTNFMLRTFASPEKYYQYVEKKGIAETAETLSDLYENCFLAGLELEKQSRDGEISLALDKEPILDVDMVLDMNEKRVYLGLPKLGKTYASLDILKENEDFAKAEDIWEQMELFAEKAPDKETVKKLLYKYFCMAVEQVDSVEKNSAELTVEGISKDCITLDIVLEEKDWKAAGAAILKEVRADEEIKNVLFDMAACQEGLEPEELYTEFVKEVDVYLERLAGASETSEYEEAELAMTVYVDKQGRIRGREFSLTGSEEEIFLGYQMPEQDARFGFEAYGEGNDFDIKFSGSGERREDNITGEFACWIEGLEAVEISVREFDAAEAKKGYLNGNFVFAGSKLLIRYTDIPDLADYTVEMDVRTDKEARKVNAVLYKGKEEVFSIKSAFQQKEDTELPSYENVIEIERVEDIFKFLGELDLKAWTDSLRKTKLSPELIDELEFYFSFI